MALDKSKPFGTVSNDDMGRAYEQDGVFYTATGEVWTDPGEPAAEAPVAKPKSRKAAEPAPEAAPSAVDSELAAQMGQA